MRPLCTISCLFLAGLLILNPGPVRAEGGLSLVEASTAHDYDCAMVTANSTATLGLGVWFPVNPSFGVEGVEREVTNLGGFRCALVPEPGVVITGVSFVGPATNLGTGLTLFATFDTPVPVTDSPYGKTVVAWIDVLFLDPPELDLPEEPFLPCYLSYNTGIAVTGPVMGGVTGTPAFVDADDPLDGLVEATVNPGLDYRFFLMQDPAVPVESGSWGAVKALYR